MQRFKQFYSRLQEEKLIKRKKVKEDEASAQSGELTQPSLSKNDNHDILKVQKDGSIGTTDVLGKCDHQHSDKGFFGPGCFHLAKPVFKDIDRRADISAAIDSIVNESEQQNSEYTLAGMSIQKDPDTFFSSNRKIDLEQEAVQIPYKDDLFQFSSHVDIFKNVSEDVRLSFRAPSQKKPFIHILVGIPSTQKAYSFFPTTNDLVRIYIGMGKKSMSTDTLIGFNDQCFDLASKFNIKVFQHTVNETEQNGQKVSIDKINAFLQGELEKIRSGTHPNIHQKSKIDRVNSIPMKDGKFDYGEIRVLYVTDAKAKESRFSLMLLTDKAILFVCNENLTNLRSVEFKDCYGVARVCKENPRREKSIPMELLKTALKNQSEGKSTLDNETSDYGF